MTAIITKRNAKDKAFINTGGGGGGGDYPTDAEFDTIKVNNEATFTVNNQNITFANHESRIKTLEQSGGSSDYPTDATFDTITVNKNATFIINNDKSVTIANHESRISKLEQSGGGGGDTPSDSLFTSSNGYDYFFVKNENIISEDVQINSIDYYKLSIDGISSATIDSLKEVSERINVLRFILRKNEIFDSAGNFIKEFYSYVENNKLYCPIITKESATAYKIEYVNVDWIDCSPFIAFDNNVPFVPYNLILSGEISIMYLLPQNTIESKIPEIKCDIITARNALKLHESNVPYLYKPSIITDNQTHYIMKFHIDPDFTIPTNMEFVFREFIFMNNWTLTWTGTEWTGNNIQGRSNGKMSNKLNRYVDGTDYMVAIGISKSEFNKHLLKDVMGINIADDSRLPIILNGHGDKIINGKFDNNEDFTVTRDGLPSLQSMLTANWNQIFSQSSAYPVYDDIFAGPIEFDLNADYKQINQITESYLKHVKEITFDFNVGGASNLYTFSLTSSEPHQLSSTYALRIKPINDVAEKLNVLVQQSNINKTDKSITLYMDKATSKARDEIKWDTTINPFQFIIDQQFYTMSPNPNAATTLYTDFNITSSKIITADNITTMRSDLNIVANTTDVIDADVKALTVKVEKVESRVTTVESKVEYLEKEVQKIKIMDDVRMVFTAVTGAITYGPKILELGGKFIKFGRSAIRNLCSRFTQVAGDTSELEDILLARVDAMRNAIISDGWINPTTLTDSNKTDLTKLIEWINSEHVDPRYGDYAETGEEDCNNPDNMYVSYSTVQEVGMYYRDSLKPAFKLVVDKFNDIDNEFVEVNKSIDGRVGFNDFYDVIDEIPEIICVRMNQRMWIKCKNEIKEGEIYFRVTWMESESDFNDMKLVLKSTYDEHNRRTGVEISEFICLVDDEQQTQKARYQQPYFDEEGAIVIDSVIDTREPPVFGVDMFDSVVLQSSSVKTLLPQNIETIVYKNDVESLNERITKLEQGNGLMLPNDFERRLVAVELKLKNIIIESDINTIDVHNMSLEERLAMVELKCANIQ